MYYIRDEEVDVLLNFREFHKHSRKATELYAQRYPNRHHPCFQFFPIMEEQIKKGTDNHETCIVNEEIEVNVLAFLEANSTASTREIGQGMQIGH